MHGRRCGRRVITVSLPGRGAKFFPLIMASVGFVVDEHDAMASNGSLSL